MSTEAALAVGATIQSAVVSGVGPQFHEECLELQPAEIDFYRREMADGDVEDPD